MIIGYNMSLLKRLGNIELKNRNETFHVITINDFNNESLKSAIKRYESENNRKVLSDEPVYEIHVKSNEQIRRELIK